MATLHLDQGLSIYPSPFTTEGRDIGSTSRRPVPFAELTDFYADMARQLADHEDATTFRLTVTNDSHGEGEPSA